MSNRFLRAHLVISLEMNSNLVIRAGKNAFFLSLWSLGLCGASLSLTSQFCKSTLSRETRGDAKRKHEVFEMLLSVVMHVCGSAFVRDILEEEVISLVESKFTEQSKQETPTETLATRGSG